MNILSLDQAVDVTGFAWRVNEMLGYGVLKTPTQKQRPGFSAEQWMKAEIIKLIDDIKPDTIALEGLHLGKNVKTLIDLAEFRGRLLGVCEDRGIPVITVTSPDVMEYLHLLPGTNRQHKKERAQYTATVLVHGSVYASDGTNQLIQVDSADAIVILEIAEARLRLEQLAGESG